MYKPIIAELRDRFDHSTTAKVIPTAVNNTADYCSILADPFDEYRNARIPDRCNLPSRVVALYAEGVLTANVNGCTGIYVPLNKSLANAVFQTETAATSADGAITLDAAQTVPGATTALNAASRIVSAGVKVESCAASGGYDGGIIYTVQKCRFEAPATPLTTITGAGSFPVQRMNGFGPAKYGAFATYRPVDEADNEYVAVGVSNVVAALQIHVSTGGLPASTIIPYPQFKYKLVIHYEVIPSSDESNGPGELAYGPADTNADKVVDALARAVPPVGGGSENSSISSVMSDFQNAAADMLSSAIKETGKGVITKLFTPPSTRGRTPGSKRSSSVPAGSAKRSKTPGMKARMRSYKGRK